MLALLCLGGGNGLFPVKNQLRGSSFRKGSGMLHDKDQQAQLERFYANL